MERCIMLGITQPTGDPTQHRTFTLRARYDAAAGGWAVRVGEQNLNDQFDGWDPESGANGAPAVFPTAAACLGAAVTRLIQLVDRDAIDPSPPT
ncbi:MAG TPA: hypothetical protein VFX03_15805 [Thermomicrobiales bacterium]|nr:hypothetical protein [Thermomicrobiales bacterium]